MTKLAALTTFCVTFTIMCAHGTEAQPEEHKSTAGRVVFTPAGALCIKLAKDSGLAGGEYGKFLGRCLKEHSPPRPHQAAVAACFKNNEELRGKGKEWADAFKSCFDKIDFNVKPTTEQPPVNTSNQE